MDRMIDKFTNSQFFNPADDKAYIIKVSVVNNMGKLEKTYVRDGEIVSKVIRPLTAYQRQQFTIEADAMLNVPERLQFYTTDNATDIVEWQNRYYKIVDEYNRENSVGYGYRYLLKYLNKDELINGELQN